MKLVTASFAVALLAFALASTTAVAYIPVLKSFTMPITAEAQVLIKQPEWVADRVNPAIANKPEPVDPQERVKICWGYLGRKKVIEAIRLFFTKGVYPSADICSGFNKVHADCFPDMFSVWDFADPKRIPTLRSHCIKAAQDSRNGGRD